MTGIGLNMTQYNLAQAKQPHNDFLRSLVETGAIGFLAYVSWLLAMIRQGVLAVRNTATSSLEGGVAAGFLGCAVAFAGMSAGANIMSNVVSVWYLVAFAAAAGYVARRAGKDPTSTPTDIRVTHA